MAGKRLPPLLNVQQQFNHDGSPVVGEDGNPVFFAVGAAKNSISQMYLEKFCARFQYKFVEYVMYCSHRQLSFQQYQIMEAMQEQSCRVAVASGHGCFGEGTMIRMGDWSSQPVETIKAGDAVMGANLEPQSVLDIARGVERLYQFSLKKLGDKQEIRHVYNESHILCLMDICTGGELEITVREWLTLSPLEKFSMVMTTPQGDLIRIKFVFCIGEGPYYGFSLSGDGRFLSEEGIILHNTGKSWVLAWYADWFLRCYPLSNTLITATQIEQVRKVIWKELDEVRTDVDGKFPWLAPYFVKQAKLYYQIHCKDGWYVMPKTAPRHNPSGVAGQHRKYYTVIVDEASEVMDDIHGVLRGALTGHDNRYIMVSQPIKPVGHFAEAFKKFRKSPSNPKGLYTCFNLNSEESPLVSKGKIREWLLEYGGFHAPSYQIKVLGIFPDKLEGRLIPRSWLLASQKLIIHHEEPWGWMMTIDIGDGVHRDSSCWSLAKVSGYGRERRVDVVAEWASNTISPLAFARQIGVFYTHETVGHIATPNLTVVFDGYSNGRSFGEYLTNMGVSASPLFWGLPPHARADKKTFKNLRAKSAHDVKVAIFEDRMNVGPGGDIVDQGANIPVEQTETGQMKLMSKQRMMEKGIKSPDKFDTRCFFFLADYTPCPESIAEFQANQGEINEDLETEADQDIDEMIKLVTETMTEMHQG